MSNEIVSTVEDLNRRIAMLERTVSTSEVLCEERKKKLDELRPRRIACEQKSKDQFGVAIGALPQWLTDKARELAGELVALEEEMAVISGDSD